MVEITKTQKTRGEVTVDTDVVDADAVEDAAKVVDAEAAAIIDGQV